MPTTPNLNHVAIGGRKKKRVQRVPRIYRVVAYMCCGQHLMNQALRSEAKVVKQGAPKRYTLPAEELLEGHR